MTPLDQSWSLEALVRMALKNIDRYDVRPDQQSVTVRGVKTLLPRYTPREGFAQWLSRQGDEVRALVRACPPNRIYQLRGDAFGVETGVRPLGIITHYAARRGGGPARAGVQVLGVPEGPGSLKDPLWVDQEGLEDVTELARKGVDALYKQGRFVKEV
jgi:hypothetical protein